MQYRSKLGLDYKQTSSRKPRKQHHYALIAGTSLIVLTIMGAVIANVGPQPNKQPLIAEQDTQSLRLTQSH